MSIYKKLAAAKKEIGKISKDSTNPFFKSKYFDINSLLEHVEPILEKHGLVIVQPIKEGCVNTMIIDVEDEKFTVSSSLKLPELNDPQKLGSAITYYRRYTLQSLLALQAEDDDANRASGNTPSQLKSSKGQSQLKTDEIEKAWLNVTRKGTDVPTPQWSNLLRAIADGKVTSLSQVQDQYKVAKTTQAEILALLNS